VLEDHTAGDPMRLDVRWTNLSRRAIAARVTELGTPVGRHVVSQLLGMAGYSYFENMSVVDAYANAAMILSGMGPLAAPETTGGKIFAGSYALYSGLILILATGLVLSPVFHRVLHSFHVEDDDDERRDEKAAKKGSRNRR
jgi:hypothetical protein